MTEEHQVYIVGNKKMIDNILKDAVEKGLIEAYEIETCGRTCGTCIEIYGETCFASKPE